VSSVEVGISNGVAHHTAPASQSSATKNNHRKSLDKGERDKCAEAENKSSLSEKAVKYSHTNGSIHTELEFIERVGYVKYVNLLTLFGFVHCFLSKAGNCEGRFVDFVSLVEIYFVTVVFDALLILQYFWV
jgi:hypothetical protein